jgi:processive 1,2-diacylglycerol beta-glucosyltransferase
MIPRILFLYVSASSGHQRAADAIAEALSLLAPTWETTGVDAVSYAYPTMGKLVSKTYLEILRRTPILWDYIYDNPDVVTATREIRELLNLLSLPRMRALLKRHVPDALVCTQAIPCSVFASERRRGKLPIPLIAVVTDFAVHSYWIHPEVDLYCVPSEETRKTLIHEGIPAARTVVTGIPISPAFLRHVPKEQARAELRLDPKTHTILVMGGSQGLGPLEELVEELRGLSVQCLIATGANRDLFRSLQKCYARDRRIQVLGYTRRVNLLMDAADLLVTKPGGLTSSEALAKGLPMIITHPIPGQEERNSDFLLRHGVAERADSASEIARLVQSLLSHPTKLRRMVEKTQGIAAPYAAMEVARHVFRLTRAGYGEG